MMLVLLLLMPALTVVAEGGVNEQTSLEGTPISSVDSHSEASAGEPFDISVTITQEASENITSVDWITQICINSGVSYPPEAQALTSDDGLLWTGQVIPVQTVTYVNWKFVLHHEDESETTIPESGFGWKVWSDCWWDNGSWGGVSTSCQEDEEGLHGRAVPLAALSLVMAALMASSDCAPPCPKPRRSRASSL